MRYHGGKHRLAPYIIPYLLEYRRENQWYIEPFCGGCNVIDKIDGKRAAIDCNPYLIAMWKALQAGWIPPENVSDEQYQHVMNNKEKYKPHIVGFVGFCCSFGGKWFRGYARKGRQGRNYGMTGKNVVLRQIETMKDVKFSCVESSLKITRFPKRSLIYCDPPYANTTKTFGDCDSREFWQWCDMLVTQGHKVFVSEKEAPSNWNCVFERNTNNDLNSRILVERLFTR